jgi:CDP-4-dehydro-6-deoxyglucose reductase
MPRLISLSQATRMVGVKRSELQNRIQSGELRTFEGAILLSDLLHAYPQATVEDNSMLERVGEIMEQAVDKVIRPEHEFPDVTACTNRLQVLTRELARARSESRRYRELIENLKLKLQDLDHDNLEREAALNQLRGWLHEAVQALRAASGEAEDILTREEFPRFMADKVRVLPSGHEFYIEGANSILEAGLSSGLALNYGCNTGTCGLCKAKVVSGRLKKLCLHNYSLTDTEKAMGYFLACCNTAASDLVIEAEEATSSHDIPLQEIDIRVKKIERPDADTFILRTRTPRTRRLRFLAGQYVSLTLDHLPPRDCSIASCPCDDKMLEFHISKLTGQDVSTYLADTLRVGEAIAITGPRGEFTLDEDSTRSLVFLACNTGFAPIKSLIEHALSLNTPQQVYLYWITTDDNTHYLGNLCRSWQDALENFHYHPIELASGQLVEDVVPDIIAAVGAVAEHDFYACLPGALLESTEAYLLESGLPASQLRMEPIRKNVSPKKGREPVGPG